MSPSPSPARRALCAAFVVLATLGQAPARGQEPAPGDSRGFGATVEASISPALDDVAVDGPAYRLVAGDHQRARAARDRAANRLVELAGEERSLAVGVAGAGARARVARRDVVRWERRVANLAVEAYIGFGQDGDEALAALDPGYTDPERRALLTTEVNDDWRGRLARRHEELSAAERERDRLRRRQAAVVAQQARTESVRAAAAAEERRLRPLVLAARATATVVGTDLTLVALDAYLRAALDMRTQMPGCGLPWWLLAGIGRVESGHGTFATSELDAGGTAHPAIIGIALDGGNDTAVITDTDGGSLDGDTVSDRAVGPMQFIPSTWARYAADGDGDGVADPQNLYDAAHAAAAYLCTAGGDLGTDAGVRRAVFAYNHSDAYVAKVLGYAQEYTGVLA